MALVSSDDPRYHKPTNPNDNSRFTPECGIEAGEYERRHSESAESVNLKHPCPFCFEYHTPFHGAYWFNQIAQKAKPTAFVDKTKSHPSTFSSRVVGDGVD